MKRSDSIGNGKKKHSNSIQRNPIQRMKSVPLLDGKMDKKTSLRRISHSDAGAKINPVGHSNSDPELKAASSQESSSKHESSSRQESSSRSDSSLHQSPRVGITETLTHTMKKLSPINIFKSDQHHEDDPFIRFKESVHDVNQIDKEGKTLFIYIIRNGNIEEIESVFKHSSTAINHQDKYGNTALHYAIIMGLADSLNLFLESHRANTFIPNSEGYYPQSLLQQDDTAETRELRNMFFWRSLLDAVVTEYAKTLLLDVNFNWEDFAAMQIFSDNKEIDRAVTKIKEKLIEEYKGRPAETTKRKSCKELSNDEILSKIEIFIPKCTTSSTFIFSMIFARLDDLQRDPVFSEKICKAQEDYKKEFEATMLELEEAAKKLFVSGIV